MILKGSFQNHESENREDLLFWRHESAIPATAGLLAKFNIIIVILARVVQRRYLITRQQRHRYILTVSTGSSH